MTTTYGNHVSSEDNLEGHIWIIRYIENKIGKTQATLITLIFLIPGTNTFTKFSQVSSSMYASFFRNHTRSFWQSLSSNQVVISDPRVHICTLPLDRSYPLQSQPGGLLLKTLSHCTFLLGGVYICS